MNDSDRQVVHPTVGEAIYIVFSWELYFRKLASGFVWALPLFYVWSLVWSGEVSGSTVVGLCVFGGIGTIIWLFSTVAGTSLLAIAAFALSLLMLGRSAWEFFVLHQTEGGILMFIIGCVLTVGFLRAYVLAWRTAQERCNIAQTLEP